MVSNDEISQRLRSKREGSPLNYLVCNKCGGYYELQQGESPEEFNLECECGGHLVQSASDSLVSYEHEYRDYGTEIILCYVLFLFGGLPALIGGLYLVTRNNERARLHGKIIIGICIGLILIFSVIWVLLIYNSYFHGPTTINSSSDLASVRPPVTHSTR